MTTQFKKCKIVMRQSSVEKDSKIWISKIQMYYLGSNDKKYLSGFSPQHLYFLSDEEIKAGDWAFNSDKPKNFIIHKVDHPYQFNCGQDGCDKIIASTDPSLNLPRPSDSFIKKYCELGGFDNVMVEYEQVYEDQLEGGVFVPRSAGYRLKVAPDNTISIKGVKNMWNREDIKKLVMKFGMEDAYSLPINRAERIIYIEKWIETNI